MGRIAWLAVASAWVAACAPKPDPNHSCSSKTLDASASEDGRALYYTGLSPSRIPFISGDQATLTVRAHSRDRRGQCIVDARALSYKWKLSAEDDRPLQFSTNADHSTITFIAPESFVSVKVTVSHPKWGKESNPPQPFPVCTKKQLDTNTC